jgi:hypothetical protein
MKIGVVSSGDAVQPVAGRVGNLGASWAQLDDKLLVWSDGDRWRNVMERARSAELALDEQSDVAHSDDLHLVIQVGRTFQQEYPDARVIVDKGRFLVVELDREEARRLPGRDEVCYQIRPLPVDTVVFRTVAPSARAPERWIQLLVNDVSKSSYDSFLRQIAGYETRHSLSPHFAAAATWVRDELCKLGYDALVEEITVGSGTSQNVIADVEGNGPPPRDLVLVVAHLDSINLAGGPEASAPGADDNGSGSAGVLEIARLLATHRASHDLRLILFGGEEEGLFGSTQHVAGLTTEDRERLTAVVNMDMIATLNTAVPTVLLEGADVSQGLIDRLADAAATYTSLVVQTSLHPFASDHIPFINASLPAVLTIEGADSANANIHTASDTLEHVNFDLALEIVRMNLAATAAALGVLP